MDKGLSSLACIASSFPRWRYGFSRVRRYLSIGRLVSCVDTVVMWLPPKMALSRAALQVVGLLLLLKLSSASDRQPFAAVQQVACERCVLHQPVSLPFEDSAPT